MKYVVDNRQIWFGESMDRDTAFAMAKRYAMLGRKPVIVRVEATPHAILACGKISYRRRYST